MRAKAFISTVPFGTTSPEPVEALKSAGVEFEVNPYGRKIRKDELISHLSDCDYLIAGTEPITPEVLDAAPKLKLIARVGVGLDNIPFEECLERGIKVTYTPDAPTRAVAELCVGLMLECLRRFGKVSDALCRGEWCKHMGSLLMGKTVGIIGVGRIGKSLTRLLGPFGVELLGHDVEADESFASANGLTYVGKEELLRRSDIVSLNLSTLPGKELVIGPEALALMKPTAFLINTSRGHLVDEDALYDALADGKLAGAALDVFHEEPYAGRLAGLDNVVLTAHIGAATKESRTAMELGAAEEVARFHRGEPLENPVTHP